jgi:hypothetical protein
MTLIYVFLFILLVLIFRKKFFLIFGTGSYTGVYHLKLANYLYENGYKVAAVSIFNKEIYGS